MPLTNINSWEEFQEEINNFEQEFNYPDKWLFRGQSNSKWPLEPSLTRILNKNPGISREKARIIENKIFSEFTKKAHNFPEIKKEKFFNSDDDVVWLSIMQHFGTPTRLLDWTESPNIALYYAVCENFDENGKIFVFNSEKLSEVTSRHRNPLKKWVKYGRGLDGIGTIFPEYHTTRSSAQQGCFTLANDILASHDQLLSHHFSDLEDDVDYFHLEIEIPSYLKLEILQKLKRFNIHPETIYPDAFGLGKSLKDLVFLSLNKNK